MPILTFPDGNTRAYDEAVTGRAVVEGIAKSLAKRTVAMALDGVVADLDDTIAADLVMLEQHALVRREEEPHNGKIIVFATLTRLGLDVANGRPHPLVDQPSPKF